MAGTRNWQAGEYVNGTLTIQLPDLTVARIDEVPLVLIKDACPLLFHVFEDGANGAIQGSIEAPSLELVSRFLCYLYTQNDYMNGEDDFESRSLLLHAQVCFMAQNYDVPQLEVAAHLNFTHATELSCCLPDPPHDLSQAIEFVYARLPNETALLQTLLHYCVGNYQYHRLGENKAFRQVVFETPEFHRGLCQTFLSRDFQDDGAAEIMRMEICRPNPYSNAVLEKRALGDYPFEHWFDAEPLPDDECDAAQNPTKRRKIDTEPEFILVHRPKEAAEVVAESDSSSDEEGFTVVHRPKPTTPFAASDVLPTEAPPIQVNPFADDQAESPVMDLLGPSTDSSNPPASPTASESSDWSLV
ncbi:hypothetical protein BDV96DRAFT_602755 [Lophiotrema nucula]|uniref:BTB domain-containing protein n=1 Tax=Lophiotrema nucula TaxID=690887 RepID=A0A6A5YY15_9PLEO|nr:hypothetical protein BDV96DRAFT_602755 [Lophiotrema nucula]